MSDSDVHFLCHCVMTRQEGAEGRRVKQFVSVGCDSAAFVTFCTADAFWDNCFPAKWHKGGKKSDKSLMRRKDSLHA